MKMELLSILITLPLLITGCSGGAGNTPATTTTAKSITAQPQALSFSEQAGQQSTVTLSGGTAPYTVKVNDPRLVNASAPSTTAGTTTFTVAPVAGGSTTIAASDVSGASTSVSVNTQICTPPSPELFLSYPASGATGVSTNLSEIWVAAYTNQGPIPISNIPAFSIRLIGSDGSIVQGADLSMTNSPPPPGSATSPGYDTYATSSVSGLKSGLTYQAQLTNSVYPCMPPVLLGSFST